MPNNVPNNDPREIWQKQPTEEFKMSTEQMRQKAQQLIKKSKLKTLFAIILGALLALCFGWASFRIQEIWPRLGFAVLSLWSVYYAYHAYRWIWPRSGDGDAAAGPSLAFYRSELERRRDYAKHVWRRAGLTFCFVGLAMIIIPAVVTALQNSPRQLLNVAPVLILLAAWIPLFVHFRKRDQRRRQQEIDALGQYEQASH